MWFNPSSDGEMTRSAQIQVDINADIHSSYGVGINRQEILALFLRAQYFSCLASTYWPAAVQVIDASRAILPVQLTPKLLNSCSRFFDACVQFIRSAVACVSSTPHPNMWILYVRMFNYSVAVLRAISVPSLCCSRRGGISCTLIHVSLQEALEAISTVAPRSDSLAFLLEKLIEKMALWNLEEASCRQCD
jgi:hypothetical protein